MSRKEQSGERRRATSWQFWASIALIGVFAWLGYNTLVSGVYKNSEVAPPVEPAVARLLVGTCATLAVACSYAADRRRHGQGGRRRGS